jgi:hypothetical protein
MKLYTTLLLIALLVVPNLSHAIDNPLARFTLSGYVRDATNGEELIGATIAIKELNVGAATNTYGYYSISVAPGTYTVLYSFVGYAGVERTITLTSNQQVSVELGMSSSELDEVVITSRNPNANVTRAEMSVVRMDIKTIQRIPALMGEVDIIKAIQMLPGVQTIAEGSSGFSVRGGAADHNLILLDEAPVYNASHLMGFFSVFNNDAVKDVKLYKGRYTRIERRAIGLASGCTHEGWELQGVLGHRGHRNHIEPPNPRGANP